MIRYFLLILILLFMHFPAHAFQLAELQTETAADLLLFFEEEELIIATRHKTPVRKAPSIATVITAKEIRNMGARNITDVLKTVPGISVSINEFGAPMFEVRGIRTSLSEKILFMIDGHPLNRNFTGSALFHIIPDMPVENIMQIEIVRGPGSALYGANAFVAAINVITKDAEEINGLQVTAKGGSFDTRQYNLLGGKSFNDDFQISGSFDYYRTEGSNPRIEADSLSGTPWTLTPGNADLYSEKTDIFLKLIYRDLYFKTHYLEKRKGNYIGMAYALTDEEHWPKYYYWAESGYKLDITNQLIANFKINYDYYEQDSVVKLMPEGFAGSFPNGMIGGPKIKNRTIGGESQFDFTINDNNHLVFGVLYEKYKQFDVKNISNYDTGGNWNKNNATREIWAAYIQDEWKIKDNSNLTAGVRHDHYSDFGGTTNPRAGLVWSFLENTDLKLLYGQAFRAPNFVELYNQNNLVNIGNEDLEPEKIKTYEAGIGHRFKQSFRIDLNYFYSKIEDLIIWDTSTSPALHVNAGKAEVKGLELVLTGNYSPDNYWKLGYTYQDPRDGDTDERLANVPSHKANAVINLAPWKYLNANVKVSWIGERPREEGDTRDDLSSSTLVDLTLITKNFYGPLEIRGSVYNLFNEDYRDPSPLASQITNDFPTNERMVMIEASYKF